MQLKPFTYTTAYGATLSCQPVLKGDRVLFPQFPDECVFEIEEEYDIKMHDVAQDANGAMEVDLADLEKVEAYFIRIEEVRKEK